VWKLSAQNNDGQQGALIGLGSNIEPEKNLLKAFELLADRTQIKRSSSIWQTKAVGSSGPDYLNAAVLIATELPLEKLRGDILSRIETELGRVRSADKYMDRTIDLDVLIFNGKHIDPELWTQAHIAVPAAQILPDLFNHQTGDDLRTTASRLLADMALTERVDLTWPAF
jgi:2-amino-4-hydroxy-6-hydroxymethyldihydropteridine diphosphokinase